MLQELSISAFGLLDNKNQVFVDIKDLNSDKINQFKNKIMDTPAIIFCNTDFECSTHLASDIHPGGPLYTTSTVNNNKGVVLDIELSQDQQVHKDLLLVHT